MRASRPESVPSLREHALAIIRDAITAGELAENRIYSAAGLAKQLGMSLSPVREAMMSLVTEGTVEAVPNRGFRLVPVTEADLEEIIGIRVLLAVPAARALCERAAAASASDDPAEAGPEEGPEEESEEGSKKGSEVGSKKASEADSGIAAALSLLREHAEASVRAAEAGDLVDFYAHDRRFHEALLEFGLGRRAADISLRLRDQSRLFDHDAEVVTMSRDSARELPVIVDLIARGRADEAAELVTENLYFFKRPGATGTR